MPSAGEVYGGSALLDGALPGRDTATIFVDCCCFDGAVAQGVGPPTPHPEGGPPAGAVAARHTHTRGRAWSGANCERECEFRAHSPATQSPEETTYRMAI